MISKWSVTNFKSLARTLVFKDEEIEEKSLDFGPLTIFCGVNSSGKSSLLQSILLVAQSMKYPDLKTPIALNGSFVKLGTLNEILNNKYFNDDNYSDLYEVEDAPHNATASISFSCSKLSALSFSDNDYPFENLDNIHNTKMKNISQEIFFTLDEDSRYDDTNLQRPPCIFPLLLVANTSIVFFNGYSLNLRRVVEEALKLEIKNPTVVSNRALFESLLSVSSQITKDLSDKAKENINNFYVAYLSHGDDNHLPHYVFSSNNHFSFGDHYSPIGHKSIEEIQEDLEAYGLDDIGELPTDKIEEVLESYNSYLASKIIYVGPLRHDPKKPYPFFSIDKSVGIEGEFTASILSNEGKRQIKYIPSEYFEHGRIGKNNFQIKEDVSLECAVNDWLKYLGVATSVSTTTAKDGIYLKVDNLYLSHVGVGVSQILPILTACLNAEEGTTLIFEQPELHLHPKLQTRLADFFLSISLSNKQCIIETHSEYIINRLRFRIASAPISETQSLEDIVKILHLPYKKKSQTSRKVQPFLALLK